ncbi:hypothetical protein ASD89_23410 [Caulobacter sp. Root656]|nr:hypothetical protein ASD89_23410 [Caulobacter sp. Root656]
MNSSGMLYTDAGLLCILVYVFWGGWAVTLAGGGMSALVMRQPGRRGLGVALILGCLAPLAYELIWVWLDRFVSIEPNTSDPLIVAVLAGLVVCLFAAPLAALICLCRPPRPVAPS